MSIDTVINMYQGFHFESEIRMANRIMDQNVSEGVAVSIGSYRGQMDCALALHAHVPLYAIDQHAPSIGEDTPFGDEDRVHWMQNVLQMGLGARIRPINLPSSAVAQIWNQPIGLLFIDGSHDYESVAADLDGFLPWVIEGGLIVMHDINTPGVMRAIEEIQDQLDLVETADITAVYKLVDRKRVPEGLAKTAAGPFNNFVEEKVPEPVRVTEENYAMVVGHGPHPSQMPKVAPKKRSTKGK